MGDCHTLFGIEEEAQKISKIFAYHYSDDTEPEELEEFLKTIKDAGRTYKFYTMGGQPNPCSALLLHKIIEIVQKLFKQKIEESLLNLEQSPDMPYISANLNLKGEFRFYHHTKQAKNE